MDKVAKLIFDDYMKQYPLPKAFHNISKDFVDNNVWPIVWKSIRSLFTPEPRSLLMMSDFGVGKTSILYLIKTNYLYLLASLHPNDATAEELIECYWLSRQNKIFFFTHKELISQLRQAVDHEKDSFLFDDNSILLIDDYNDDHEDKQGWNVFLEKEFFDRRWRNYLPTFVASNLTVEELQNWSGHEKIVSRLFDPAWMTPIVVGGESKRKKEFYDKISATNAKTGKAEKVTAPSERS